MKKNKYHNMTEEQKNKRREYERHRYRNLSEEQKNKKRGYVRNRYYTMVNSTLVVISV